MSRIFSNIFLLLLVVLLQSLFFDNMTFGMSLTPLVYISFIMLQPMQRSQFEMICIGFTLGVTIDLAVGMAGVNTIATLAVSYLRIYLLQLFISEKSLSMGGIPLIRQTGALRLTRYCISLVTLHSLIYFGLESMNFAAIQIVALRFALSLVVTLLFTWLTIVLVNVTMPRYSD